MSEIRRIVKPGFLVFLGGGIWKFGEIFPIFWGRKNYNICWEKTVIDDDDEMMMMKMMIHPSIHHHIQHPSSTSYFPLLQLLKTKMAEIRDIMNPGGFFYPKF